MNTPSRSAASVAYLTGTYPRATDTFIQREVAALRQQGISVYTFAVRQPSPEQLTGPTQHSEHQQTTYLLPVQLKALITAHLGLLRRCPRAYVQALALAWKTRNPGWGSLLFQCFYFLEAGVLAHQLSQRRVRHLHNHFGDSSCSVAMLAALLCGCSYSFTLHGPGIFFEPQRWRLDEKIRRASFVSCISYFCRSQAMIYAPLDSWERLKIVHCGIDAAQFKCRQHRGQGRRLLYVGRLAAAKGLPILLESLATLRSHYPQLHLTIVGDGPNREALTEQVRQLEIEAQVEFVGYQAPSAVSAYLEQSDLFVMSSFAEGVPVVLMEAMAAGLPVIAPQIAGISELVEAGRSGYLVPPSNVPCLADCIDKLVSDADLRQRFGQAGWAKVEQEFNQAVEAQKLGSLIAEVLAKTDASTTPIDEATANTVSPPELLTNGVLRRDRRFSQPVGTEPRP